MCVLLPLLTAGRYRHADLTPDYQLRVWDERKRDYVEKSLFSGGTQDQFSLGLRLGFALAALPRELGTSPGFLFLDEPLSSFDRERSAALVELITRGQIALYFPQVFLISHSQTFPPELFSHHITMEDGRVAYHTLPEGPRVQGSGSRVHGSE
jgi:exonuclease SbcC